MLGLRSILNRANDQMIRSTLFAPFVPFICIFGNVIAQLDSRDLALLGEFVSTLRSVAEQSDAVEKLHHACSSFHQIAKAFLAHHSKQVASSDCQALDGGMGEFAYQPLSEVSLSQQDWDVMLREWDLGLYSDDARQMSYFLGLAAEYVANDLRATTFGTRLPHVLE